MSSELPAIPQRKGGSLGAPIWAAVALAGAGIWAACAGGEVEQTARAWRGLLVAFLFFTPLAAGMVVWSAVVALFHGRWVVGIERWALGGAAMAPLSLAAYVVLWMGGMHCGAWSRQPLAGQEFWFGQTFVLARDLAGLILLWGLSWWYVRRRTVGGTACLQAVRTGCKHPVPPPGALSAVLALTYAGVMTLLALDLAMSLDPRWYSTLFGGYFLTAGLYAAAAAWTLAALLSRSASDSQRHDLGMILVAMALITTYMMYSQLLPIWYGNLPRETRYVVPRLREPPWTSVSAALLAAAYLGPLVLLLSRGAKRCPFCLGAVSVLILAGLWLERWWLVTPAIVKEYPTDAPGLSSIGLADLAAAAAFAGALGLALTRFAPKEPEHWRPEVDA